jgi:hypothetical protein
MVSMNSWRADTHTKIAGEVFQGRFEKSYVYTETPGLVAAITEEFLRDNRPDTTVEFYIDGPTIQDIEEWEIFTMRIRELVMQSAFSFQQATDEFPLSEEFIISSERAINIVSLGDEFICIMLTDQEICNKLWEYMDSEMWGIPFTLDSPDITTFVDSGQEIVSPEFGETLETAVNTGHGDFNDLVELGLLLGAFHDELLRDVVEWFESLAIATQGTISKVKNEMEQENRIDVTTERIGVGRPRQRLHPGEKFSSPAPQIVSSDDD